MPFSIQTKYLSKGSFEQGDVIAIRPFGFEYHEGDCLSKWLESGRDAEDWPDTFVINYIIDENMSGTEPEVQALVESAGELGEAGFKKRKCKLLKPSDYNNVNRKELRETGETRVTWAVISQLLADK